ncbi:MAG: glycosyltransferase family 2 protein [Gemmatimonadetes bacterium]|nr:glycosyltransferase family 2 protein [Gemmatimonadota bacterium]
MTRPSISAIVITLNEEDRLARCLESVRWVNEIVVLDCGSTDRTAEIARRYTDRFVVSDWPGFGVQKQCALEKSTCDWVLSIDADEEVEPELARRIEAAVAEPRGMAGFELEFRTYYLGRPLGERAWRRERHLRLFRRDRAHFRPVPVHERPIVDGPVGRIEGGVVRHYTYRDLAHQVEKLNRYTTLAARQLAERGEASGVVKALLLAFTRFLHHYLLRGGIVEGQVGAVRAAFGAADAFLKYSKLWEIGVAQRNSRDTGAENLRGKDGANTDRETGRGEPAAAEPDVAHQTPP